MDARRVLKSLPKHRELTGGHGIRPHGSQACSPLPDHISDTSQAPPVAVVTDAGPNSQKSVCREDCGKPGAGTARPALPNDTDLRAATPGRGSLPWRSTCSPVLANVGCVFGTCTIVAWFRRYGKSGASRATTKRSSAGMPPTPRTSRAPAGEVGPAGLHDRLTPARGLLDLGSLDPTPWCQAPVTATKPRPGSGTVHRPSWFYPHATVEPSASTSRRRSPLGMRGCAPKTPGGTTRPGGIESLLKANRV